MILANYDEIEPFNDVHALAQGSDVFWTTEGTKYGYWCLENTTGKFTLISIHNTYHFDHIALLDYWGV